MESDLRVAILGRSNLLSCTAHLPYAEGHEIGLADLRKSTCNTGVPVNWLTTLREAACTAFPRGVLNRYPLGASGYIGNIPF